MTTVDNPFPPEALDANQNGRLTEAQRSGLRTSTRAYRGKELLIAAGLGALGVACVAVSSSARSGQTFLLVGIGCLVVAAFLTWRAVAGGDALTRDLRNARVDSAEGAILKRSHTYSDGPYSGTTYWLYVAGRKVQIDEAMYDAAPETGYVRLYFLSKSHRVVNLERLADRPAPEGTTIQSVERDLFRGLLSRDTNLLAETGATATAFARAITEVSEHVEGPPATENLDPRPLDEAILGSWSSPMMRLSFLPGGSVSSSLTPAGRSRSAHWSVDTHGKLHTDLGGRTVVADAWVAGNRLVLSMGNKSLTLEREPEA
jgi:hypothetical protein